MPYFGGNKSKTKVSNYRMSDGYFYTLVLNDCLLSHPERVMRSEEVLGQTDFRVSLERFWFCLTGLKKKIYHGIYGCEARDYLELFDRYRLSVEALTKNMGYQANVFIVFAEDIKQMAVLFSSKDSPRCTPEELAEQIGALGQQLYDEEFFHGDRRFCNVTALSDELHGFTGIREGYLQVRRLNDLSYFRMETEVLNQARLLRLYNQTDYNVVMETCTRLCQALDKGDTVNCRKLLEHLFLIQLKHAYSWLLLQDCLSYCKCILQIRRTARNLEKADLDHLCSIESFLRIEECMESIWPLMEEICEAVKIQGVYSELVLKVIYYVKLHYAEDISRPDIARYINVTPSYLSNSFCEEMGISVREFITRERIEAAKQLLTESKLRVADISESIGIHDVHYFTRIFKRLVGMTPAQYRKTHG